MLMMMMMMMMVKKNSGDCDGNRVDGVTANGDVSNIKYLIGET